MGTASIMKKLVCFHMFAHGRPPGQHRRRARASAKCIKTHRFLQDAGSSHGENLWFSMSSFGRLLRMDDPVSHTRNAGFFPWELPRSCKNWCVFTCLHTGAPRDSIVDAHARPQNVSKPIGFCKMQAVPTEKTCGFQ